MKIKILAVSLIAMLLSSCGSNGSIVRDNSASNNGSEITDDSNIVESLVSGIGLNEFSAISKNATEHLADILNCEISLGQIDYVYDETGKNTSSIKNRLSIEEKRYTNDVLVFNLTADEVANFDKFGFSNSNYGCVKEYYLYLDEHFDNILKTEVYTKGEIKTVITAPYLDYNLTNYDYVFSLVSSDFIPDPSLNGDKLVVAGKMADGRVYARYLTESVLYPDSEQLQKVQYRDLYFTNKLMTSSKVITNTYNLNGSIQSLLTTECAYTTNTNGLFDKSAIPTA